MSLARTQKTLPELSGKLSRAWLGMALLAAAPCLGQNLPTYVPVEQRLEAEIRKILDAGHLAPGLSTFEQHYRYDSPNNLGYKLDDYWHNPAELVYTIARALPHLPAELRTEARAYLHEEFQRYPPTDLVHMGPEGARREYAEVPEEYAGDWPFRYGQATEAQASAFWPGWSFNPFNIYACAKYAEVFPEETKNVLGKLRSKVAPMPNDVEFLRERPHVVNQYIAGYQGYLDLQRMAGEAESSDVRAWLDAALNMRVEMLKAGTAQLNGSEAGGFLWLTPELGEHLHENARDAVAQAVHEYNWAAPYWFVSNAQETTRFWTEREFMEGYHAHIYDTMSQFQARAYALKYARQELEPLLDASSVARGDLYYIQNLIATLSAGNTPAGGVRRGRERRYAPQGE